MICCRQRVPAEGTRARLRAQRGPQQFHSRTVGGQYCAIATRATPIQRGTKPAVNKLCECVTSPAAGAATTRNQRAQVQYFTRIYAGSRFEHYRCK